MNRSIRSTVRKSQGYARRRQYAGLKVARVNCELQVLRRMFGLAIEWGKVGRILPRVRKIRGAALRESRIVIGIPAIPVLPLASCAPAPQRDRLDPELASRIAGIKAVDNHAHPVRRGMSAEIWETEARGNHTL
jgi:hypothetical protein